MPSKFGYASVKVVKKLEEFFNIFSLKKIENNDNDDGEVLKGVGVNPETFDNRKLDACSISFLIIGLQVDDVDINPENEGANKSHIIPDSRSK